MRFLRLDLERYGPFGGHTLNFREDARLHVVYGANEAGKSCALAAITDLLFGFEHNIRFDFLHDAKELRIGARLRAANGGELAFRRRRGNKNTLVDAADKPLGDDALAPLLGGLSRDVFCRAFGLDTQALRRAADEMRDSSGDLGAALAAAASGLRGLNDLRRALEAEAGEIYSPTARIKRFNRALARQQDAIKAVRDSELKASEWKALNTRITELAAELDDVAAKRRRNSEQRARLARLKRVASSIRLIDDDLAQLALLQLLPEVPPGFTDDLRRRLDAVTTTAQALRLAETQHEKLLAERGRLTVDDRLLAQADEIMRLFGGTKAYGDAKRDLPRIEAEADQYDADLQQLAARLGLPDTPALEAAHPADATLARVRQAVETGRALAAQQHGRRQALAAERELLAELERQRASAGGAADPRPLRERLDALAADLKQIERRADLAAATAAEDRSVRDAAARLRPVASDLAALAVSSLPAAETIARFRGDIDRIAGDIERAAGRLVETTAKIAGHEAALKAEAGARPVPSLAAIAAERAARDAQWLRLRATLFGEADALDAANLVPAAAGFERHRGEADRLADEAVSDAKRVAHHSLVTAQLQDECERRSAQQSELEALRASHEAKEAEWRRLWQPADIDPLPPGEMAAWLLAVTALLARRDKNETLRGEIATLDAVAARVAPALAALAAALDLAAETTTAPPPAAALSLAMRIGERLRVIGDRWDGVRDLDTRMGEARRRIRQFEADEAAAAQPAADWQRAWVEALPSIGLHDAAGLEEADAALNAWKDAPSLIRERNNRAKRVAGMLRDIEAFEETTEALTRGAAPDLVRRPADAGVADLHRRLQDAGTAATRRSEADRRLAESTQNRDGAQATAATAETALAELASGLPPHIDLSQQWASLTQRDGLQDGMAQRRRDLLEQADGFTEAELRADLAGFDRDQAAGRLVELEEEDERLTAQAHAVFAEHDREQRRRAEYEKSTGAETAVFERRSAEAELMEAAREWLVLRLGALMIGGAIEHHRVGQQDPLMAHAGKLFATLTGNAFRDLAQDYDETDTPRLAGRRAAGQIVPVAGMSEGTRDQLYLSLRLAYLSDYASRAEPAPFIADDLFATSDDARTANGLAALAAIGEHIQPILFTHHRRVAETAQARIGSAADIIEL